MPGPWPLFHKAPPATNYITREKLERYYCDGRWRNLKTVHRSRIRLLTRLAPRRDEGRASRRWRYRNRRPAREHSITDVSDSIPCWLLSANSRPSRVQDCRCPSSQLDSWQIAPLRLLDYARDIGPSGNRWARNSWWAKFFEESYDAT